MMHFSIIFFWEVRVFWAGQFSLKAGGVGGGHKPWAAAAREWPLYMGHTLYQLSAGLRIHQVLTEIRNRDKLRKKLWEEEDESITEPNNISLNNLNIHTANFFNLI